MTPGLLQNMSKKCNSLGEFPGIVVFLDIFSRKIDKKIAKCNSQGVTTVRVLMKKVFGDFKKQYIFAK